MLSGAQPGKHSGDGASRIGGVFRYYRSDLV